MIGTDRSCEDFHTPIAISGRRRRKRERSRSRRNRESTGRCTAGKTPPAQAGLPFSPASHSERRCASNKRRCLRNTSNADPNGEPGCALTHAIQAGPQSSHDCHHSPAGHSSGSKRNNLSGGTATNGDLRCIAITAAHTQPGTAASNAQTATDPTQTPTPNPDGTKPCRAAPTANGEPAPQPTTDAPSAGQ
jgi:hypothetical protein